MVSVAIGFDELLVAERADGLRGAARIEAVGGIREDQLSEPAGDQAKLVAERALHFVVDHALVAGLAILLVDAPALLQEDAPVLQKAGRKHRIQIDADEVQKVLRIAAGHRIDRPVGIGQRVQEGVQ